MAQGVLAGTEVAVVSVRRTRLHALLGRHEATALAVQRLRDDPGPFAATVQMGVTALSTTAGALGGALLASRLAEALGGSDALAGWAPGLALGLVTLAITLACVLVGDLLPLSVALRASVGYAALFSRPLLWLARLSHPVTRWLTASSERVVQHPDAEAPAVPPEALALHDLVDAAAKSGSVHPAAADIAARALTFGDLTVADVMVPRHRVHALSIDATPEEIRRVLLEEGHSCMPVYDGTLDHIVGILVAKDVLALAWERALIVLHDLLQPPYFAPEIMRAADLLKALQRRRTHFAIAVDELGGTAGIVTVEDVLEELVGEIVGEHDANAAERIRQEPDGTALVQGMVPVRDVNRELHLGLPEGDTWSTVGGLCVGLAGRIPDPGCTLTADDGTTLEVCDASPRQVNLVRLRRAEHDAAPAPDVAPPAGA